MIVKQKRLAKTTLTPEVHGELERMADRLGVSLAEYVRNALLSRLARDARDLEALEMARRAGEA